MDRMDRLDRLLMRLPSEPADADLAKRVFQYVRARQRRTRQVRIGLSLALAAGGVWLILLASVKPTSLDLSASGMTVLLDWLQAGLVGLGSLADHLWNGAVGLQSGLAAPVTVSAWIGLVALTLSVLLALGQLLPQGSDPGFFSEGAKA